MVRYTLAFQISTNAASQKQVCVGSAMIRPRTPCCHLIAEWFDLLERMEVHWFIYTWNHLLVNSEMNQVTVYQLRYIKEPLQGYVMTVPESFQQI